MLLEKVTSIQRDLYVNVMLKSIRFYVDSKNQLIVAIPVQAPNSWILKVPENRNFVDREIIAIEVRDYLSPVTRLVSEPVSAAKTGSVGRSWQKRKLPAASRHFFWFRNFTCTSFIHQCVHVKFYSPRVVPKSDRSGRIKTGTSFPSLALMYFAWAPRFVSFFRFK